MEETSRLTEASSLNSTVWQPDKRVSGKVVITTLFGGICVLTSFSVRLRTGSAIVLLLQKKNAKRTVVRKKNSKNLSCPEREKGPNVSGTFECHSTHFLAIGAHFLEPPREVLRKILV